MDSAHTLRHETLQRLRRAARRVSPSGSDAPLMRVCVAGLGIQGAACVYALAARGADVIGTDRHTPPHALGSSHGQTRILRFAYYEAPLYVPLVQSAFEGWSRLGRDTGRDLFRITGALSIGPESGELLTGVRASIAQHQLAHEELAPEVVRRRFGIVPPPGCDTVFESTAGVLAADACLAAFLQEAARLDADIETEAPVLGFWETPTGVIVRRAADRLEVDAFVLATGPWLARTAVGRSLGLRVERQVVFWYDTAAARLPALLCEYDDGRYLYWVPGPGDTLKAALHHDGEEWDSESVSGRVVAPADEARLATHIERLRPGIGKARTGETCLYTNSPDGHFVVDRLPGHERVYVVSACSGHGFKFAPAIGEMVAGLVLEGRTAEAAFAVRRPALRNG